MVSRRRVLHILQLFRPDFSGEAVFLERCSAMMHALDPSVEHDLLVTQTPEPARPPAIFGVIPRLTYLTRRPVSQLRHEVALLWWMARNLHRYHVVHVRAHADWYFLSYALAKLAGRRLVLSATLDDSVPGIIGRYSPSRQPVVRRLFRLFDAFVSVSAKLHQETSGVMPPERCHLIEYGLHLPGGSDRDRGLRMRAKLGIPQDALVLIFVGGLCARKDPMLLVRNHAAILERVPDCWLLLLGPELEPDYVRDMRRLAQAMKIEHRIVFAGQVDNPHLYFEAADVMTFASRLEGFGMVVPEAMGHALPVVVRRLLGVNDSFVQDGVTGFVLDGDAGYRDAVLRLAGDPALRRSMGLAGQVFVRSRYDPGGVARQYLHAYGLAPPPAPDAAPVSTCLSEIAGSVRTASIPDRRFHAPPVAPARAAPPRLIVLADAEEAFDWDRPFSRDATDVTSMRWQEPAHRIYERYGVAPTYLVDYSVVSQDAGRAPLLDLLRDGRCDVGAKLHPWVTPPFREAVCAWNSYAGNLPLELEYEKLQRLTEQLADRFGVALRIFRAGRYGAGARTAELLLRLGYEADSSVMPHWDFSRFGGPDYSGFGSHPHWLDAGRRLLEIPNSAAFVGRFAGAPRRAAQLLFRPGMERMGLPGIAARLGMLERIKLTPEGTYVDDARRLVRTMLAAGHRVFVVSYHTPSLQPGNTPYVRTGEDLRRFLAWLDEVLDFFRSELGGVFATWRDVRADALAAEAGTAAEETPGGAAP